MNIEYVLGQEKHTSSWAKFYVKGLEKWAAKEDFEENFSDKHHAYQGYTCLDIPGGTIFTIFEQSGDKRGTQDFNFYICETSADALDIAASSSRGRCQGNFKIVCAGEGKTKAPRLMDWWIGFVGDNEASKRSNEEKVAFALHCADYINKRGLKELPPFSPRTEEANTTVETLTVTEELSPRTEAEAITPEDQQKQWLNLGLIALNAGTQSRRQTNQATIDDYAEQMADGRWNWEQRPLPIIFSDGKNFYPGDGHHRIMAADKAKIESIFVEIHPGTLREAVFSSTSANKFHGLPRSNADKRNQVELLLSDSEWQLLSDRAIADHCGVSAPLVGKIRAELAQSGTVNISTERIDKSGRKLQTANIGTKPKEKPVLGEAPVVEEKISEVVPAATKHQDNGVVQIGATAIPVQEEAINGVQPKVLEKPSTDALHTVAESQIELLSQKIGTKTVALIALDFCPLDEIKEIHAELTASLAALEE